MSLSLPAHWKFAAPLAFAVFAALLAVFWPTFESMRQIWDRSDTFAHGYLVFPLSAWLVWRIRSELARVVPRVDWRGVAVLAVAGAGWLLADAGSVLAAAQYALVTMLVASVWATLGARATRAMLFPLLFLFMAVPVGEFLIPPMMEFTADFAIAALRFTGLPVYREGLHFSIPSGDWSVVEACSGVRYLIASIMLGLLFAYLTYRSWKRRLLFAAAAVAVPILANGCRAYMIVMIGHLSNNRLGVGVDHVLYGWVFFGAVMLVFFWVGTFWREDQGAQLPPGLAGGAPSPARAHVAVAVAAVAVGLAWQGYAGLVRARPLATPPELVLSATGGWRETASPVDLDPHWQGADRRFRQAYTRAGQTVLLFVDYYASQRQDAELVNSQNYIVPRQDPAWAIVGEGLESVVIAGASRPVNQTRLLGQSGGRLLLWQWNMINGAPVISPARAKLELAWDRIRYRRDDGASILIAAPYGDDPRAAAAALARFAADMQPALDAALRRIEGR